MWRFKSIPSHLHAGLALRARVVTSRHRSALLETLPEYHAPCPRLSAMKATASTITHRSFLRLMESRGNKLDSIHIGVGVKAKARPTQREGVQGQASWRASHLTGISFQFAHKHACPVCHAHTMATEGANPTTRTPKRARG